MTGIHNPADLTVTNAAIAAIAVTQAVILAIVQNTHADLEIVDGNVDAIRVITDAEGILTEAGFDITTDGTEQDAYINNTPAGVYEPRLFQVDFANQTVTETLVIRTYYRHRAAGPWVLDDMYTIAGVPVNALISTPLKPNRFGTRVTLELTAGTNRVYPCTVFYEV